MTHDKYLLFMWLKEKMEKKKRDLDLSKIWNGYGFITNQNRFFF